MGADVDGADLDWAHEFIELWHGTPNVSNFIAPELNQALGRMNATRGGDESYWDLSAVFTPCKELHVAGHSMGGGLAQLFAFLANHKNDLLRMNKTVTKVYTFGAPPLTNGYALHNHQAEDGCFDGDQYFNEVSAQVAAKNNVSEIIDQAPVYFGWKGTTEAASKSNPYGMHPGYDIQHLKMRYASLEVGDGTCYADSSKCHGVTAFTKCGSTPAVFDKYVTHPESVTAGATNYMAGYALHHPWNYFMQFASNQNMSRVGWINGSPPSQ